MISNNISELRESFQRDGYIFIPGFLSKTEITALNTRLEKYIRETVPLMAPGHVFYEDKNDPATLKQLQDMNAYDAFFDQMLSGSRFQEIAEILLEEKVIGKTLEYFNKPPKIGKPTPPHQDGYYFMLKPSKAVTMWMALEDVDQRKAESRMKGRCNKPADQPQLINK